MAKLFKHSVLVCGILSPLAALVFYSIVYETLTRRSANLEGDWLFRLSVSTLAMTVPFLFTLGLAIKNHRVLSLSGKIGIAVAMLSLLLVGRPVHDGILRARQTRNMAMRGVAAPPFDTADIFGNTHRLNDQTGKVVLVNIWATWCQPCRNEMPRLDQLYRLQKARGLVVFGISNEDVSVQKRFLKQIPVSYPLLTLSGHVPSVYRDIARYPAIFLIDRGGRLQPAPAPDQPFEKLEAAVDALLSAGS